MNDFLLNTLELLGLAWWIEIVTESPNCTYYFGPYAKASDAAAAQPGFIEDLEREGAKPIRQTIKRCRPTHLTVEDQADEKAANSKIPPLLSSQA
jgi:Domain of unknown function (DUF1816)